MQTNKKKDSVCELHSTNQDQSHKKTLMYNQQIKLISGSAANEPFSVLTRDTDRGRSSRIRSSRSRKTPSHRDSKLEGWGVPKMRWLQRERASETHGNPSGNLPGYTTFPVRNHAFTLGNRELRSNRCVSSDMRTSSAPVSEHLRQGTQDSVAYNNGAQMEPKHP